LAYAFPGGNRTGNRIIAMFNSDDQFTPASLNRLRQAIREKSPLVVWVGAGASRWAELPSWRDSAKRMRKVFRNKVANYPDERADSLIASQDYPGLFQLCKDLDRSLYNKTLLELFNSPTLTPLYLQFIDALKMITPIQVVTTNVDLCLEQQLGVIDVIERSDIERCSESIRRGISFVAKLHGSVSSIESCVFTTLDYQQVKNHKEYTSAIKSVFSSASVIFLGYGLKDEYVVSLLSENDIEHSIFGTGPHFHIKESAGPAENGVFHIGYTSDHHQDHRAALTVFNLIEQEKIAPILEVESTPGSPRDSKAETLFYISSFTPSGTHISGQFLELAPTKGENRINAITGLGFVQGELPSSETVAFHDLAVGLTCFDRVLLPLTSLHLLHDRATPEVFWTLMESNAIKFVDIVHDPFFVAGIDSVIGEVGIARIQDPLQEETRSTMSVIRKMIKAIPGKEQEADKKIEGLAASVALFADSEKLNLAAMVRSSLLLPQVSRLLGYSDYAMTNKIPNWLAYPTLRLAHLVQTGLICDRLGIQASRVPFGGISLLSAAFSTKPAEETVFDYASFVMAGAYGSNLSRYFELNPQSLLDLVKFRETAEGEALRREIAGRLDTNDGAEFSAAVDGGLKRAIPKGVLQAARNKFSTLLKSPTAGTLTEALWTDSNTGDLSIRLWRDRSRELLLQMAKVRGARSEDPCLCGSGDRLRDCCLRPLRSSAYGGLA
jgi:hypothetical protein